VRVHDLRPDEGPALKPSAELLSGAPEVAEVRISPDGTQLAYLAPLDGVPNVWLSAADGSSARPLTHEARALSGLHWTADGSGLLVLRDGGGDELHHLWSLDTSTGELRDLTPHDGVQAQLVGLSSSRPRHAAVALNLLDPTRHDLYVLSLDDGSLEGPVATGATRYAVDAALRLRLSVRLQPDGSAHLRGPEDALLEVVSMADTVPLILGPVAVSHDGSTGFLLSSAGEAAVVAARYDLATGERTVLHRDNDFDVCGFSVSPLTGEVDLVCVDGFRRSWHGPGSELLGDPSHDVLELLRSHDDSTWLVRRVQDCAPAQWWTVRPTIAPLLRERPDLEDFDLGTTDELAFSARDGRRIRGYVTFPPGVERRALPAVLWVHGGPWARDRWGFDPVVQLFATRGYAVVQVNYRGSTGYGKEHLDAGDREWGGRMQTDLADAIDSLSGVLDPARVAIAGGSYGGYATLMGLVTDPGRYRCGIAWCAPSNLLTLLRSFPPYWASLLAHWHARVGHPDLDANLLWERSPLAHLDDLAAPLLLVHGANDPRVLPEESRAVASALAARGVPHTFHEVPGEGHGFAQPANNVWLLEQVEQFLAEHLPAFES
jgi:dipeptidyl aminopeptidase/acylaminoacyl peptidase